MEREKLARFNLFNYSLTYKVRDNRIYYKYLLNQALKGILH